MTPPRARLRPIDLLSVGFTGLRTRRVRIALSALGIAIGIASLVAVLGVAASAQADLLAQIDRLGTNLLTVGSGQDFGGAEVPLPATAPVMVGHIDGLTGMAATAELRNVHAYRNDLVPVTHTGSLSVRACDLSLLSALDATVATGTFHTDGTATYPVAVLGDKAAATLGATDRIWVSGHWLTVAGTLRPLPLTPEIDRSVLIGFPAATRLYGYDGRPSRIYLRAATDRVADVADKLARTANPTNPSAVTASRPSDALIARLTIARSGTGLFLGLGVVALLVGAIGVANVMVISVLERRAEIGLRRALGARRLHIAAQFFTEALLLSTIGAVAGIAIGTAITAALAYSSGWTPTVPPFAIGGGLVSALVVGALAGLYPATRAANLLPTEALRSP